MGSFIYCLGLGYNGICPRMSLVLSTLFVLDQLPGVSGQPRRLNNQLEVSYDHGQCTEETLTSLSSSYRTSIKKSTHLTMSNPFTTPVGNSSSPYTHTLDGTFPAQPPLSSRKTSTNTLVSQYDEIGAHEIVIGIARFPVQSRMPTYPEPAQVAKAHGGMEDVLNLSPMNQSLNTSSLTLCPAKSIHSEKITNFSNPALNRLTFPPRTSSLPDYDSQHRRWPTTSSWPPNYSTSTFQHSASGSSVYLPLMHTSPQSQSLLVRCLRTMKNSISSHVDPKTIKEMIDFRELVYPFGVWKYTVLTLVAIAIAGIIVSEHYFRWIQAAMAITRRNMLPVLVIVIGLEPVMISIVLLVARVATLEPDEAVDSLTNSLDLESKLQKSAKATDHRTALVIPCHNSDRAAMKKVLESAYPHFRPQDIFIVDNGRTKYPPDDFRQFIREQHADIVYIWSPIGSKNAAQLVGALAAKTHEFIMTVDDDVSIPSNFCPPIDKIDHLTKGVAFPLRAIDVDGKSPLFMVAWQDCEYKMSGVSKLAESSICGVLYPHGAGWFCERETLIDLISNYHSLDFIAEDVNTGLSMQKMKKRIAFDSRMVLETEVPTTLFGPGLNWWQQRKNSWEMGRHGRLMGFAGRLFLSLNGQTTIHGILAQKFIHSYAIATIVVDWVRVPVLITMGSNVVFWRQALLLMLASILPLMAFKYINARKRPDLQPGFWGCLTYPFYKQLYALVSIVGAIRSVTFYIGGHKRAKNVRTMIKENDERVFWKDPRFETNPAFLADEGEMLKDSLSGSESEHVRGFTSRSMSSITKWLNVH